MESSKARDGFEKRLRLRPLLSAVEINENGLVVGAGSVLARMTRDRIGAQTLALDEDARRLVALYVAAFGTAPRLDLADHLEGASRFWKRGDKALANIRLAFARLPRLERREDAYRLFLAECFLEEGTTADELVKVLGLHLASEELCKFNADQPRVPAGSGRSSGQWASDSAAGLVAEEPSAPGFQTELAFLAPPAASGVFADALFTAVRGSAFLAGLDALGLEIGAGVVLNAIFVRPTGAVSEGQVPGDSKLRYSHDAEEGSLRLLRQDAVGSETVAIAHQGRDGIFFELKTRTPVALMVGGSIVFDADQLAMMARKAAEREGEKADAAVQARTEQPKLCPDPDRDQPHGAKEAAIAYQMQISALNNPQRPLPPDFAVALFNPKTGKNVHFDDCRESDGTMIEAKGPGYAAMLKKPFFSETKLPNEWIGQARRQVDASGERAIEWYFAESEAAEFARELFKNTTGLEKIKVIHVPAIWQ